MEQSQLKPADVDQDRIVSFAERVPHYRDRVDESLERALPADGVADENLVGAMRYAVLGGGKRIRPLFAYASAELVAAAPEHADAVATAIELVHAYSLVHDDLPAMDDDELRRGRPTVHIAYDEATAVLVGDALQALAFSVLADPVTFSGSEAVSAALVRQLADAAGADGMVGGQALDLAYSGKPVAREDLEGMFARKTGRLIAAAIRMPAVCGQPLPQAEGRALDEFARIAGLCFQIHDDVLDVTRTTEQLGKPSGSDERNERSAYPARFGLMAAMARAEELLDDALRCLDALGPGAEGLRWLTDYIVTRDH